MKSGTYIVSFEVELTDCEDINEAEGAVRGMVENLIEEGEFPEVNFQFVEGTEQEYTQEEDEVEELDFEEAV